MRIVVDDLSGPAIAAFLRAHVEDMIAISPPESKHALDLDGLRRPEITFWSMKDGEEVVGCGAILRLDEAHGEIKSMRSAPDRRGTGIGSALMEHILREAKAMGLTRLSLETGSAPPFEPARRLYEKFGFEYTSPFAGYTLDPHSVYLTKAL